MTRFPGPLLPQWEGVVNTISCSWSWMELEMWERYWHEFDMLRNAFDVERFDRPSFDRPRFTGEHLCAPSRHC